MKYTRLFLSIFSVISFIVLSGCCPEYLYWLEDRFPKADRVCMDLDAIHAHAVRTQPIRRDGLMTDEIPRVMWRSDAVVEFHERMSEECSGERPDMVQKRIDILKEENKNKAIFFVSLYGTKHDWSFTLCKDGQLYGPAEKPANNVTYEKTYIKRTREDGSTYEETVEVKKGDQNTFTYKTAEVKNIDLDRIYKHIFGKAAFRYRQNIYQVTFDVALEPPFDFKLCNGQYTASLAW